jgi:hypothetical protein
MVVHREGKEEGGVGVQKRLVQKEPLQICLCPYTVQLPQHPGVVGGEVGGGDGSDVTPLEALGREEEGEGGVRGFQVGDKEGDVSVGEDRGESEVSHVIRHSSEQREGNEIIRIKPIPSPHFKDSVEINRGKTKCVHICVPLPHQQIQLTQQLPFLFPFQNTKLEFVLFAREKRGVGVGGGGSVSGFSLIS